MESSVTNAFLEGGKFLRTNVARKEWNIEVLMFLFDVTSQATVTV